MIVIAPAIKALLLGSPNVTNLVGARVYDDRIPTRDTLPGPTLVLTTWPMLAQQSSEGATGIEDHRLQLDAYAGTRSAADGLMATASAVLASSAVNPGERIVAGVRIQRIMETGGPGAPTDEQDTRLARRMQTFRISAARAA